MAAIVIPVITWTIGEGLAITGAGALAAGIGGYFISKQEKTPRQAGGSGNPRRHVHRYPSRKRAEEAARDAGGGLPPIHHPGHKEGERPHFHPTTKSGDKKGDGSHYEYPGAKGVLQLVHGDGGCTFPRFPGDLSRIPDLPVACDVDTYFEYDVPSALPDRFRAVNDYSGQIGFQGGWPNMHQAKYDHGLVFGAFLFQSGTTTHIDIPVGELGNPKTVPERFRAFTDRGAVPNFHQARYNGVEVYGGRKLRDGAFKHVDIPVPELRGYNGSPESLLRAVGDWASSHGFAAGVPTFHQAVYNGVHVRGALCFSADVVEWRDLPAYEL